MGRYEGGRCQKNPISSIQDWQITIFLMQSFEIVTTMQKDSLLDPVWILFWMPFWPLILSKRQIKWKIFSTFVAFSQCYNFSKKILKFLISSAYSGSNNFQNDSFYENCMSKSRTKIVDFDYIFQNVRN